MKKIIRYYVQEDRKTNIISYSPEIITDYSEKNLVDAIDLLEQRLKRYYPSNIYSLKMYLDWNTYKACLMVYISPGKNIKLGQSQCIQVHEIGADEFNEDMEPFKKEAYRIKRFLKYHYPDKQVTSYFDWKYIFC